MPNKQRMSDSEDGGGAGGVIPSRHIKIDLPESGSQRLTPEQATDILGAIDTLKQHEGALRELSRSTPSPTSPTGHAFPSPKNGLGVPIRTPSPEGDGSVASFTSLVLDTQEVAE